MIRIYRIYNESDANYESWYGTSKDIIDYLDEEKSDIEGYNANSHWELNLEVYGLVAEVVYAFEIDELLTLINTKIDASKKRTDRLNELEGLAYSNMTGEEIENELDNIDPKLKQEYQDLMDS